MTIETLPLTKEEQELYDIASFASELVEKYNTNHPDKPSLSRQQAMSSAMIAWLDLKNPTTQWAEMLPNGFD